MAALNAVGAPLNTAQAPAGIVSFELSRTEEKAGAILASWDAPARLRAAFSLGLDYLFMPAYAAAISLGCMLAAQVMRERGWHVWGLGAALAWGQWVAAVFDGIENLALVTLLFGAQSSLAPLVAWACALIKFALIAAGLAYGLFGLISRFFKHPVAKIPTSNSATR